MSFLVLLALLGVSISRAQQATSPLEGDMPNKSWYTSYRAAWNVSIDSQSREHKKACLIVFGVRLLTAVP